LGRRSGSARRTVGRSGGRGRRFGRFCSGLGGRRRATRGRTGNRFERRNRLGRQLGLFGRRGSCGGCGGCGRLGRGSVLRRGCRLARRLGAGRCLGPRRGQHAADEIGDVVRDHAQLVLSLEDAAEALVKKRDQVLRRETDLFCKFKDPNFSGSQILPFTLQAPPLPQSARLRGRLQLPSAYRMRSPRTFDARAHTRANAALFARSPPRLRICRFTHGLVRTSSQFNQNANSVVTRIRRLQMQAPDTSCFFPPAERRVPSTSKRRGRGCACRPGRQPIRAGPSGRTAASKPAPAAAGSRRTAG